MKYFFRTLLSFLILLEIKNCLKLFEKKEYEVKMHIAQCPEYPNIPIELVTYKRVIKENGKIYYNYWNKINKNIPIRKMTVGLTRSLS